MSLVEMSDSPELRHLREATIRRRKSNRHLKIVFLGRIYRLGRFTRLPQRVADLIPSLMDVPEALPYIVEAFDSGQVSTEILSARLRTVEQADGERFDDFSRRALASALRTTSDAELAIAIVGVMGRIGGAFELRELDSAADGHLNLSAWGIREVRSAALISVSILGMEVARQSMIRQLETGNFRSSGRAARPRRREDAYAEERRAEQELVWGTRADYAERSEANLPFE